MLEKKAVYLQRSLLATDWTTPARGRETRNRIERKEMPSAYRSLVCVSRG